MTMTGSDLRSVRQELSQSLAEFGRELAKAIHGPRSPKGPYSRQYIARLERGQDPITPAIQRGLQRIMAAIDEADPDTTTAQAVTVYATQSIGGSLVTGKAQPCARPGCRVKFVPTHPRQKYHSAHCRLQAYKAGQAKKDK